MSKTSKTRTKNIGKTGADSTIINAESVADSTRAKTATSTICMESTADAVRAKKSTGTKTKSKSVTDSARAESNPKTATDSTTATSTIYMESATASTAAQETQRNPLKGKRGAKRIYNAFFYSVDGIKAAYADEEAFRQIVWLAVFAIPLGAFWGETWAEKILLILPCFLAIIAELINSAIENAVDFAGLKTHALAKKAKDMGSAIQLLSCVFWAIVWGGYLAHFLMG